MRRLRVLILMHAESVPPKSTEGMTDEELCALPFDEKRDLSNACGGEAMTHVWNGIGVGIAVLVFAVAAAILLIATGHWAAALVAAPCYPLMWWHGQISKPHDAEFARCSAARRFRPTTRR